MKLKYRNLPYRENVACLLFKGNCYFLVQKPEWPDNFWKFPQGGIKEGESIVEAATRELIEEIGNDKFTILHVSKHKNRYDWDEQSIVLAGIKWRGQNQGFVIAEYTGTEEEIKIDENELKSAVWIPKHQLQTHVDHNHPLFSGYWAALQKVFSEFINKPEIQASA